MALRRSYWTSQGHPAAVVAAEVGEAERGGGEHDEQDQPGPQGGGMGQDDAVDDLPLDQRHDGLADAAEHRAEQRELQLPAVPEHVAPQAPDPARAGWRWCGHWLSLRLAARRSARRLSMAAPSQTSDSISCPPSGVRSHRSLIRLIISVSTWSSSVSPGRGQVQGRGPLVPGHPGTGQQAALAQRFHRHADGRLADGQLPGDVRGPFIALRDRGQHPVVGQAEIRGRPLQHRRGPGQRPDRLDGPARSRAASSPAGLACRVSPTGSIFSNLSKWFDRRTN